MAEVTVSKDLENKKLVMNIVVNGPLDKVWRAYTEKNQFEKWWGPEGWETTVKEFTFEPGGRLHYGMKCVDENQGEWYGQESWGLMEIQAVDPSKSFTYKDYFSDETGAINNDMPILTITNEYSETDGKTHIISTCQADSAEQIEQLIKMGMVEGFTSQLGKLEVLVG